MTLFKKKNKMRQYVSLKLLNLYFYDIFSITFH